jgi:hypothetical protein
MLILDMYAEFYMHCYDRWYMTHPKLFSVKYWKLFPKKVRAEVQTVSVIIYVWSIVNFRQDGSGIESRWGGYFPYLSRPTLGPTQPPVQLALGLSQGKDRSGRDADPSPPSSAAGHERLELYLCSPYGTYGL